MTRPGLSNATTTRRGFLTLSASAIAAGQARASARTPAHGKRPNFVVIVSDQLGLDAIGAHGCPDVATPHLDRLVQHGVTFRESHSTNPVCSPARSSIFTGRMPVETGVITNDRPIHASVPNMGQWLREHDYHTFYCGKWHLPHGYPVAIDGFSTVPVGGGQGDLVDPVVSRNAEAFLKQRPAEPFLFVASFMQPHDICYWAIKNAALVPPELPFPQIAGALPALPPNHRSRPAAPQKLYDMVYNGFNDAQWRHYIYTYYRQVEMLDAQVGRVVKALEDAGLAEDTIILLTADHGEGRGRHMHVQKWYPYDESVKVPFIVSCPARFGSGLTDDGHLVSGLDVMNTVCDFAGCPAPPHSLGRSVRPLLEDKPVEWRGYVVAETHIVGRTVRSARFKYVRYEDDPVEQLFDMHEDPWETRNLYESARHADVLEEHRKLLVEWNGRVRPVEPTPHALRGK